jgi:DNA invertase Pin-like site-specific DNA recombinase
MLSVELRNAEWIMYLRKSRQDDPNETVEEVLAKHEAILQEWAKRELGREISEDCIYREIISGESLAERVEVQKVLNRIEDLNVVGVLVVEPQRLSRGDLEDCGKLISTLRYTKTLVATPMITYDMENKMERRFFQDELMRGRDYLEYTKEILSRGRIASIKRGSFLGNRPPLGYDKVTIGKNHTLVPNDNADVVKLIFDWYVHERLTYYQIATRLTDMGLTTTFG